MATVEQRTDPETHRDPYGDLDMLAAVGDADALAGALADVARLTTAIRAALDVGNDHVAGLVGAHDAVTRMRGILRAALAPDGGTRGTE